MDDDVYGDMLKMPHIKPVDRQKYRKVRQMQEEYFDNLIDEIKNTKFDQSQMKDDRFELLLKVFKNAINHFNKKDEMDE